MNKIGWTDITKNYVRGCLGLCPYCYARRFNQRTWKKMFDIEWNYRWENDIGNTKKQLTELEDKMRNFKPVFMYSQFAKTLPRKPNKIFLDSMSDIAYWQPEWMEKVLNKIKEYPQHQFLFLTKEPKCYLKYNFSDNCWLGTTVVNNQQLCDDLLVFQNKTFLSIEPILSEIYFTEFFKRYNWIILGAESGNRKNKIIPKLEWIESIVNYCIENKIPIFMKDNLKPIINNLIQQFPSNLG